MNVSAKAHHGVIAHTHLTFLVTFQWLIEEETEHNISCFWLENVDSWNVQQLQRKPESIFRNRQWERTSLQTTTGFVQIDKPCFLTRQHSDADGAFLAEWLHRMLRHAGVLSFVHGSHLAQCQLGGRQDPVTTLKTGNDRLNEEMK